MTISKNTLPLAITAGEPAGIGPTLVAKLWQKRKELDLPPFLFVGPKDIFQQHGLDIPVTCIKQPDTKTASIFKTSLPVIDLPLDGPITLGEINPRHASMVIQSIKTATALALKGDVAGIVTNPIQKASLYAEGFSFQGHTDFLAHLAGLAPTDTIMMLMAENLRVVPVTIHIPLKNVASTLTSDAIVKATVTTAIDLRNRFGITNPRFAIAGLNPHAGESGTIGLEEGTHIIPAIRTLQDMGISVTGPHPADTLFHAEARENYDAVIAMYHDQALIPIKTLDFYGGVNVTLGLNFIRTSPDHGTALNKVKTGNARPDSLLAAIRCAHMMANHQ